MQFRRRDILARVVFPALRAAPSIPAADPASLIHVVVNGTKKRLDKTRPFWSGHADLRVAVERPANCSVLTFVRNAWANAAPAVSEDEVRTARRSLAARAD